MHILRGYDMINKNCLTLLHVSSRFMVVCRYLPHASTVSYMSRNSYDPHFVGVL
jgi:hypothetical protein